MKQQKMTIKNQKKLSPLRQDSFFLFLGCIWCANLVNIIIVLATYKTYLDMVW